MSCGHKIMSYGHMTCPVAKRHGPLAKEHQCLMATSPVAMGQRLMATRRVLWPWDNVSWPQDMSCGHQTLSYGHRTCLVAIGHLLKHEVCLGIRLEPIPVTITDCDYSKRLNNRPPRPRQARPQTRPPGSAQPFTLRRRFVIFCRVLEGGVPPLGRRGPRWGGGLRPPKPLPAYPGGFAPRIPQPA